MKEFIFGWIQDIAFYTLLMEVVLHVLPEQGQKKYLQFFMGIDRKSTRLNSSH